MPNQLADGCSGEIRAGLALGWTLSDVGDREADFVRITEPDQSFGGALWLLTHDDLRTRPRFGALLDFMAKVLSK